jgi:hypothetical protein
VSQATLLNQLAQLENPDAKIVLGDIVTGTLLSSYAYSAQGIGTTDNPRFVLKFWEVPTRPIGWEFFQTAATSPAYVSGCNSIFAWGGPGSAYFNHIAELKAQNRIGGGWQAGSIAWGRPGFCVNVTRNQIVCRFAQGKFDTTVGAIIPNSPDTLEAIFLFLTSPEYQEALRGLDQSLSITESTLVQVPIDLSRWTKLAQERLPEGLPAPFSFDPTQWVFRGDVPSSDEPLQVAMSLLVGYRWPDQSESPLHTHADEDGIVTLAPLVNQDGVAGRLRALLQAAYESEEPARPKGAPELKGPRVWNENIIPNLLVRAGSAGMSLDGWPRDTFFDAHTKLFQQRPFI